MLYLSKSIFLRQQFFSLQTGFPFAYLVLGRDVTEQLTALETLCTTINRGFFNCLGSHTSWETLTL